MNTTLIIILVVGAVVVVALIVLALIASRRRALRQKFGPEYDRAVADSDSKLAAERELRQRERRHAELELKPLSPESRAAYAEHWGRVQAQFVDSPEETVRAGDVLVTRLVGEIGYPTDIYDDRIATLSVEHAATLGHYRDAHDIFLRTDRGEASTEQLRQALVHYRALFAELLGNDPVPPAAGSPAAADTAPRAAPDEAQPAEEHGERPAQHRVDPAASDGHGTRPSRQQSDVR